MSLRQTLWEVTRAIHKVFDTYPDNSDDAAAVRAFLEAPGSSDAPTFYRLASLPVRAFLKSDIDVQWANAAPTLWADLMTDSDAKYDWPACCGPHSTLLDIAIHIEIE